MKRRNPGVQYRTDPLAFLHDNLVFPPGQKLAAYQEEIIDALPTKKRIAVRAPHGAGKTALASWLVLWAVLTSDDVKVVTTASAWRQLTKYLWPEVRKWARRIRWEKLGRRAPGADELQVLAFKAGQNAEAFAVASDNPAMIEGAHADRIVYVFDEAKAIPAPLWDAAEGAFSTGEAYAIAISTPGEPSGRFYDIHSRRAGYEDWWARHVTLDECVRAGRISEAWAEQRKKQWGERSAVYVNRVLGEFAASDSESVVIPLAWVEAANRRWNDWSDAGALVDGLMSTVGVDVGRGGDRTVLAPRWGNLVTELRRSDRADTMHTVGLVSGVLERGGKAIVDVIGIGAGVVDRLNELGLAVEGFNAGERTDNRDVSGELGFVNKRSSAWWRMRELLDPANDNDVALPPDDYLVGDLTAPTWKVTSGGKVQVESKDEIRDRLGRSTDDGDAVVMSFWGEDPLPSGMVQAANTQVKSRFTTGVAGGRWKRNERTGWHR